LVLGGGEVVAGRGEGEGSTTGSEEIAAVHDVTPGEGRTNPDSVGRSDGPSMPCGDCGSPKRQRGKSAPRWRFRLPRACPVPAGRPNSRRASTVVRSASSSRLTPSTPARQVAV